MQRVLRLISIALVIFIAHWGCAQNNPVAGNDSIQEAGIVIGGVPFVKQKDEFCGPAAMASVLEYYGDNISQDEIAEKVYTPKLNGALISDMENYARDRGYQAETVNGDIAALEAEIDKSVPVILLVDKGKWKVSVPHYYVAYGYDAEDKVFIVHTGQEPGQRIPFDRLDGEWEKMNRLMLIVTK